MLEAPKGNPRGASILARPTPPLKRGGALGKEEQG